MPRPDQRVDAYIASAADFAKPILNHLRKLVHQGCPEVEETMKWSFPNFIYHGIMCNMAAFKQHCAFGFWKRKLLFGDDPKVRAKMDEAMGQFGRITSISDLPEPGLLLKYIREAARINAAGIKTPATAKPKPKAPLRIPVYFAQALKHNPPAKAAFDGFSYSHRKEYIEWITEAKTEPTRQKRVATTLEWLTEGKPRNWKYMSK